ncbi:IS3 family transposase [Clostridium tetanomorphum]|uniref:IS3 family transposase n=1 Tax=Clostridium tetanomorphum TaxID=1553 RepID=UPI0015703A26|nr:IS3 family transposase [Clostridium tetanomorphum]NRZ95928.1 transposase InsO family protein [Clostridium tetanomorphum]
MSKKIFTEVEILILNKNHYVKHASEKSITYTDEFKVHFIREYLSGKSPTRIFESAGFNKDMIGYKRIERAASRWKKDYAENSWEGLKDYRKANLRTTSLKELSQEYLIKKQKARIKLLEAEVELLKKIDLKERRLIEKNKRLRVSEIFELIQNTIKKHKLKNVVSYLCKCSGVSRSGYYNYITSADKRKECEKSDENSRDIILMAFNYRGYKKGSRSIKMTLKGKFDINFNRKRIQRIMRKYNIICPIRKRNPYKKMQRINQEYHKVENILNRNFKQSIPRKVLLTDITYLKYGKGKTAYLSTIKDSCTNEIIAYNLSQYIDTQLVINTFKKINHSTTLFTENTIVHSNQGCHYTSSEYKKMLKDLNVCQSMSRKGNCWDNAPQESFFGHMKDEIDLKSCQTYEEVSLLIDDYMSYYNQDRYQWNLKKMTPEQYRNHLLSA